jgi:hypothetical protein
MHIASKVLPNSTVTLIKSPLSPSARLQFHIGISPLRSKPHHENECGSEAAQFHEILPRQWRENCDQLQPPYALTRGGEKVPCPWARTKARAKRNIHTGNKTPVAPQIMSLHWVSYQWVIKWAIELNTPLYKFHANNIRILSVPTSHKTCQRYGNAVQTSCCPCSRQRHIRKATSKIHLFLTSAPDGDEWPTSRPGRFTPEKNAGTHWIGSWMGPRAGLHVLQKRKISCSYWDSNPGRLSP